MDSTANSRPETEVEPPAWEAADLEPIGIRCVTPFAKGCIHRFFDTSPFSPSGRYLAAFQLPFEDRVPEPGEKGVVWVVDLRTGKAVRAAETCGWGAQIGPNLQWGGDDDMIVYNDVDTRAWRPGAVALNWRTGAKRRYERGVSHVDAAGRRMVSPCLARMRRTQLGYGVTIPDPLVPRNVGPREDDGIYLTDLRSGDSRLVVSIAAALEAGYGPQGMDFFRDREVYAFHSKWSPQGDRILFSLRHFSASHGRRFNVITDGALGYEVFTARPDGSELRLAVPDRAWRKGGHHVNWFPCGTRLSMNLNIRGEGMRFVQCDWDGSNLRELALGILGSGHPTALPGGRYLLTDAYATEPLARSDGTVPLRLVDCREGRERELARVRTRVPAQEKLSALRVDPHPAWERGYRRFAFNALRDGSRSVFVADFAKDGKRD